MQEQETAVEMGLKEMLAEAVDALMLHRSYQQRAIDSCVVAGLTDPAAERRKLDAIKAALAYFERLAAVEVESEEFGGSSDFGMPSTSYVSFAAGRHQEHVWKRSSEDSWFCGRNPEPDAAALCLLAAALECRKRNGGMG